VELAVVAWALFAVKEAVRAHMIVRARRGGALAARARAVRAIEALGLWAFSARLRA